MNYYYQIDYSYFIINGQVCSASKINSPLGNWKDSAKEIEELGNNEIVCYLRKSDGSWERNQLLFDLHHLYENANGNFVKKELEISKSLPRGNWITSMKNLQVLVSTTSDGNGKLQCELRTLYGNYVIALLDYNITAVYFNSCGLFSCLSSQLYDSMNNIEPIPKKIFQTHKSLEYVYSKHKLKLGYHSWTKYKDFEYFFYNDMQCEQFVQEFFDAKTLQAYQKCPIAVMKADLWRYCVIYVYGGIYADMDAVVMVDPVIFLQPKSYLVCSIEFDDQHLCQWTFAAPPKSPILKTIIDLSVQRILDCNKITGNNIVHILTGPEVFTDGIECYLNKNHLLIHKSKLCYVSYQNCLLHCMAPQYFHNKIIRHLFTGVDEGGWKNERDILFI